MSLNQQHIFRHRWGFFSPDTAVFCIVMCHVVMCALWNADRNMSFVFVLWQCDSTFAPWLWKQWCWMMCAWGVTSLSRATMPSHSVGCVVWVMLSSFCATAVAATHSPFTPVTLIHWCCTMFGWESSDLFFVRLHPYCCLPFAPWLCYGGTVYLWSVRAALWPPPYSASVVLLYQPTVRGHWVLCHPIYYLTTGSHHWWIGMEREVYLTFHTWLAVRIEH